MTRKSFALLMVLTLSATTACSGPEQVQAASSDDLPAYEEQVANSMDAELACSVHGDSITVSRDLAHLAYMVDQEPVAFLAIADKILDDAEAGLRPRGSFSDHFDPVLSQAKRLGADQREINRLVDRLVALAREGEYVAPGEGGLERTLEWAQDMKTPR